MEYVFRYENLEHLHLLPPEHGEVDDYNRDCHAILQLDVINMPSSGGYKRKMPVRARCNFCRVLVTFWIAFNTKK